MTNTTRDEHLKALTKRKEELVALAQKMGINYQPVLEYKLTNFTKEA